MTRLAIMPDAEAVLDQGFGWTSAPFEIPWPGGPLPYFHTGEDIGDDFCYGCKVIATRPGYVAAVGMLPVRRRYDGATIQDAGSFGLNAVAAVFPGDGVWIVLGHLAQAMLPVGADFNPGTVLGLAGGKPNAGQGVTTGPHLHAEVQPAFHPFLDPATAIPPRPWFSFKQETRDMRVVTGAPLGSTPVFVVSPSGKYPLASDGERDDWLRICGQPAGVDGIDQILQATLAALPTLPRAT